MNREKSFLLIGIDREDGIDPRNGIAGSKTIANSFFKVGNDSLQHFAFGPGGMLDAFNVRDSPLFPSIRKRRDVDDAPEGGDVRLSSGRQRARRGGVIRVHGSRGVRGISRQGEGTFRDLFDSPSGYFAANYHAAYD